MGIVYCFPPHAVKLVKDRGVEQGYQYPYYIVNHKFFNFFELKISIAQGGIDARYFQKILDKCLVYGNLYIRPVKGIFFGILREIRKG
jgi:hypothetical protein